jgi:signal transduction histidine kinase
MADARTRLLAVALWVGAMASAAVAMLFTVLAHDSIAGSLGTAGLFAAIASVGVLVIRSQERNSLGWLFLASSFAVLLVFALNEVGVYGLFGTPGAIPGAIWLVWLGQWGWVLGFGPVLLFMSLLFPDGRLPSRGWRPFAWGSAVFLLLIVVASMFVPGAMTTNGRRVGPNPAAVNALGPVLRGFLAASYPMAAVAALVSAASVVVRYRRADGERRRQIKWFAFGVVFMVVMFGAGGIADAFGNTTVSDTLSTVGFLALPAGAGIAILRYQLWDIDVVINKTVVYALLAAFITAVYVAIVVGIGQVVGSTRNLGLSILATALVAVGFQPVRDRVQHFANRLVYGKRATPYQVLSEFSGRMSGAYASEELLPRMARILAEGTGAARANVWLHVGTELYPEATWPEGAEQPLAVSVPDSALPPVPGTDRILPVTHQGELLGALSVTKSRGDSLRPAEEKLMADLASGAGLVLRNVRLTAELLARLEELKQSRQRIVAAQDEERRKLERNLHDGAQQQLVALQVKLSLAERLAEQDCRVKDQLSGLKIEAGEALENLRDLARGIYPPLLADQGLAAALTSQARKATLPVSIESDGIGRYPQEQEAAVYFCVLEALQNVAKYAGATHATVRLHEDDGHLAFEVTDDGAGFDTTTMSYGTGLQGMADRLSAQGGTLEVSSRPGDGTTVMGRVPVGVVETVG